MPGEIWSRDAGLRKNTVALDPETGALAELKEGTMWLECGTTTLKLTAELYLGRDQKRREQTTSSRAASWALRVVSSPATAPTRPLIAPRPCSTSWVRRGCTSGKR